MDERFELRRLLGRGGNGKVFEAFDRLRNAEVALKVLRQPDPIFLYLFKREFRELTGVVHPRLVKLYELFAESDRWFYTMELVRGVSFMRYVRSSDRAPDESAEISIVDDDLAGPTLAHVDSIRPGPNAAPPRRPSLPPGADRLGPEHADLDRLRRGMRQLAEGVRALHTAGRLHLDLKPTNVLVRDKDESLVLLDFGLAVTMRRSKRENLRVLAGTPQFMAPEQVLGEELSEATDWYAVGVMLYEALTGRLPFAGSSHEVLEQKMLVDPLPPASLFPDVDRELDKLCVGLLKRSAAERPSEREIMKVLGLSGVTGRYEAISAPPPELRTMGELVGREHELELLESALDTSAEGRGVVFLLHGGSGIGKSSLVETFVDRVAARDPLAIVIEGRCYEQESVPYKGIDAIVDGLSRFLSVLPEDEVLGYLPAGAKALAQLFPVLGQIAALKDAQAPEAVDQGEVRRVAFRALRDLLDRIASRRQLILCIDDLQWSDMDSVALLLDVLRPPRSPRLMFIGSYRSEERERSEPLMRLRQELAASSIAMREVELGPLGEEAARRLALEVAGDDAEVESLVSKAGGSPFLVVELARYGGSIESLDQGIVQRVELLSKPNRRLVEVICLAGHPIQVEVATRAASFGSDQDVASTLAELRAHHLIRGRSGSQKATIEPYHDRIREAISASLSEEERVELHRRLARALEAAGADAVYVLEHLVGCGDHELAGRYAVQAAHRARSMLAFDTASSLYALAIEAGADDSSASIRRARAECLVNAGRYVHASDAFLGAAARLSGYEAWDLRRIAAGYLIVGGEYERGMALCDAVFREVGIRRPKTHLGNIISFLRHEIALRFRGIEHEVQAEDEVDTTLVRKMDALWTAGRALAGTVPLESAALIAQGTRLALHSGVPKRIAINLGLHAGAVAAFSTKRFEQLREPLTDSMRHADDPYSHSVGLGTLGIACIFRGQWREGVEHLDSVEHIFRAQCQGVAWELVMTRVMAGFGLYLMGEYAEVSRRHSQHMREAEEREDRNAAATLFLAQTWMQRLAWDDPDGLSAQIDEYVGHLNPHLAQYQHYYEVLCRVAAMAYRGAYTDALKYMTGESRALKRGGHFRIDIGRVMFFGIRAAQCLGAAQAEPSQAKRHLRLAARYTKQIDSAKLETAHGMAALVRGGIAKAKGNLELAVEHFEKSEQLLRHTETHGVAECARFHRGLVIGGDEGQSLCLDAAGQLRARGVRNPIPFMSLYLPHHE